MDKTTEYTRCSICGEYIGNRAHSKFEETALPGEGQKLVHNRCAGIPAKSEFDQWLELFTAGLSAWYDAGFNLDLSEDWAGFFYPVGVNPNAGIAPAYPKDRGQNA